MSMRLSLRTAATLVSPAPVPYEPDEELNTYHHDLLAPFGIEVDEQILKQSSNVGCLAMSERLLRAAPIPQPDLLVFAYSLPDMCPLKTVAAHLNHLLGGQSRSFAVSEQGLGAPFTALKIADAYARSSRCTSLALFVCDQTTLPYRDAFIHDTPLTDSAALLYFDADGRFEFCLARTAAPGQDLGDLATSMLAGEDEARVLVVAGPWVAPEELTGLGPPVRQCADGTYCTSVWLELARDHQEWATFFDAVLLCDADPRTGSRQAALLRRRGADHGGGGAA
jgi:hypothetical protein